MNIYTIYRITNIITQKVYIGYTSFDIKIRFKQHIILSKNKKQKSHLQSSIAKYGVDNFIIQSIYQSKEQDYTMNVMEPYFIKEYDSYGNNGYNETPGGEGRKHYTKEQKLKHGAITKEKMQNPEIRKNISNKLKLKWQEPEYKANRDAYYKSEEFILKCKSVARYGKDNNLFNKYPWEICKERNTLLMLIVWSKFDEYKLLWEQNNKPTKKLECRKIFNTKLHIGGVLITLINNIDYTLNKDWIIWKLNFLRSDNYKTLLNEYNNQPYTRYIHPSKELHHMFGTLPWECGKTKNNPDSIYCWLNVDKIYDLWKNNNVGYVTLAKLFGTNAKLQCMVIHFKNNKLWHKDNRWIEWKNNYN